MMLLNLNRKAGSPVRPQSPLGCQVLPLTELGAQATNHCYKIDKRSCLLISSNVNSCASRRVLDFLDPVKFFHAKSVDTLIDADSGAGATTGSDGVPR
mmetsp:Transcript_28671/g.33691  ORF Transcript_28671/g.33691 Transcript_28671/m.33691 type:complete len:98 (+) Transcript_28671:26-319(+)